MIIVNLWDGIHWVPLETKVSLYEGDGYQNESGDKRFVHLEGNYSDF